MEGDVLREFIKKRCFKTLRWTHKQYTVNWRVKTLQTFSRRELFFFVRSKICTNNYTQERRFSRICSLIHLCGWRNLNFIFSYDGLQVFDLHHVSHGEFSQAEEITSTLSTKIAFLDDQNPISVTAFLDDQNLKSVTRF